MVTKADKIQTGDQGYAEPLTKCYSKDFSEKADECIVCNKRESCRVLTLQGRVKDDGADEALDDDEKFFQEVRDGAGEPALGPVAEKLSQIDPSEITEVVEDEEADVEGAEKAAAVLEKLEDNGGKPGGLPETEEPKKEELDLGSGGKMKKEIDELCVGVMPSYHVGSRQARIIEIMHDGEWHHRKELRDRTAAEFPDAKNCVAAVCFSTLRKRELLDERRDPDNPGVKQYKLKVRE